MDVMHERRHAALVHCPKWVTFTPCSKLDRDRDRWSGSISVMRAITMLRGIDRCHVRIHLVSKTIEQLWEIFRGTIGKVLNTVNRARLRKESISMLSLNSATNFPNGLIIIGKHAISSVRSCIINETCNLNQLKLSFVYFEKSYRVSVFLNRSVSGTSVRINSFVQVSCPFKIYNRSDRCIRDNSNYYHRATL